MGKGGKGGKSKSASGTKAQAAQGDDDDALLAAAIAENLEVREREGAEGAGSAGAGAGGGGGGANGKGGRGGARKSGDAAGAGKDSAGEKRGLLPEDLVKKLNAVPCFCLLNRNKDLVPLKDPRDPEGKKEMCCWFADAHEAKATLEAVKAANPKAEEAGIHLGVSPLGMAYGICVGWINCHFFGEKVVRGSQEAFADGTQDATQLLREQAISQGLESPGWHVPVFCCDELQSDKVMPVFLSRKALAETWVTSGRKLADIPKNMAVLDLGVLLTQMQADGVFDWSTVQFLCERKSVQLVQEARAAAAKLPAAVAAASAAAASSSSHKSGEAAAGTEQADDAPPPLE